MKDDAQSIGMYTIFTSYYNPDTSIKFNKR